MSDDKRIKKYFENMPYGGDAKSSEIHGKANQQIINQAISHLAKQYDVLHAKGDKQGSQTISEIIKNIARQLDNLKAIKEEFAVSYGGGVGGKNTFSNYTDLNWDRAFFGEYPGSMINIDENYNITCSAVDPNGVIITKEIGDITENWVIKGTEEAEYMQAYKDLVKQGQTAAKHPDFDIDWTVDNLLTSNDAWKVFVSDKIGGVYFLQEYMLDNQEALKNFEIPDDMLHPDSFNPNYDTRLHKFYTNRLKSAFDPNYKTIRDGNTSSSHVAGRTTIPGKISDIMNKVNGSKEKMNKPSRTTNI